MKAFTSLFLLMTGVALASTPGFERYQVILDRMPFGDPPPAPVAPPPAPTPPHLSFARTLRVTAMYETDDGLVRVGLVDSNGNKSFILREDGAPFEGIELVSADYAEGEVVLRKGTEMAVLRMGEAAQSISEPPQRGARPRVATQASYEERRRARTDALQQRALQPPREPPLTGEALEQHLQEYQMEVIRQGLPPLPIPLTPEMDAQLVAEGVLPP
jgi:hypothetical protein